MKPQSKLAGLWLSPLVVSARLPILWLEALNPDPRRRDETNRMVVEKIAAVQEGIVASQLALGAAMAEASAALMFGMTPKGTPKALVDSMIHAGLAPAARRVRANHRRLGRL
jgi:hypothetical protein